MQLSDLTLDERQILIDSLIIKNHNLSQIADRTREQLADKKGLPDGEYLRKEINRLEILYEELSSKIEKIDKLFKKLIKS